MQIINDRYEFDPQTDELGKGGFGRIFKARDTLLDRDVVLKYTEKGNLPDKYSLVKEISRVIDFNHPNLVRYYDAIVKKATNSFGEEVEYQIGVMEYVRNGDLKALIEQRPSQKALYQIVEGVLSGLGYLHDKKIIHRDIKPGNILLNINGDTITPKICDFGISKLSGSDATVLSNVIGTFEYMSPEQLGSNPDQKIRTNSDLWAIGILIYELFFNELPFGSRRGGITDAQIVGNILGNSIPEKINEIPNPYKDMIEVCLIKDPDTRPSHVNELLDILRKSKESTLPPPAFEADSKPVPKETPIIEELPTITPLASIPPPIEKKVEEQKQETIQPVKEIIPPVKDKTIEPNNDQKTPPTRSWSTIMWLIGSPILIFFFLLWFDDQNIRIMGSNDEASGLFIGGILALIWGAYVKKNHRKPIDGIYPALYMGGFAILAELVILIGAIFFIGGNEPLFLPGLYTLFRSVVFLSKNQGEISKGGIITTGIIQALSFIFPLALLVDMNEMGFTFLGVILAVILLILLVRMSKNTLISKTFWMGVFFVLNTFIFSTFAAQIAKSNGYDYYCSPLDLGCVGEVWFIWLVTTILILVAIRSNKFFFKSPALK